MVTQSESLNFFKIYLKHLSLLLTTAIKKLPQSKTRQNSGVHVFQLNKHQSYCKLKIELNGEQLKNDSFPVYLRVILYLALSFKELDRKVKCGIKKYNLATKSLEDQPSMTLSAPTQRYIALFIKRCRSQLI